jgi:hypothetical protein
MRATRADWRRAIDWSAVKDPNSITNVIGGLLSRRRDPMREKEIKKWFHATPKAAISEALLTMAARGQCQCGGTSLSRNRRVACYWTDNRDE